MTQNNTLNLTLILVLILLLHSTKTSSSNTEMNALMDIKASLDPKNKILTTWKIDGDPCNGSFEGIACNQHSKVANISLQGKGLNGKLSSAISELKSLNGLYLHYNSIYGEIPVEIGYLVEIVDLYLNVNNLSGGIPGTISHMVSLQVMDLGCNQLTGNIPTQISSLNKLTVLSLQYNQFTGSIPSTLANLTMLKRLDLSYNRLSDSIPPSLADIPTLHFLDVRNNSLSGLVPISLKKLKAGFSYKNNLNLCGTGFIELRKCTSFDNGNIQINIPHSPGLVLNNHTEQQKDESKTADFHCNISKCSNPKKFRQIIIIIGIITSSVIFSIAAFLTFISYRRQKQKVGTTFECGPNIDHYNDVHSKSASPLVSLAYSTGWDPLGDGLDSMEFTQEGLQNFRYNLEEIESATQYFSEGNVLGRGKFSSVYKAVLRDKSVVVVKSLSVASCKSEEADFVKGLNLLVSLKHRNLVNLRGFCCSRGRGECFLVYDFAPNGHLGKYLSLDRGSKLVLDWPTRVHIINGIAKGLCYLHEENGSKPQLLHQNISAEKILIDENYNPLILDSGLRKILADDTIFSALKVSAAMGYLAPEYITTGRFTEKSDIYSFGVIVLHVISGKQQLTNVMRTSAESSKLEDIVDRNLDGMFSISEAMKMVKLGLWCIHEFPDQRPNMKDVVKELI